MAIQIQIKTPKETTHVELKNEPIIIGRSRSATCTIDEDLLSRLHLEFSFNKDGSVVVKDLGSKNGTKVNDIKINNESILYIGDVIAIGSLRISLNAQEMNLDEIKTHTRPPHLTNLESKNPESTSMTCLVQGLANTEVDDPRKASTSLDHSLKLEKKSFKLQRGRGGSKGLLSRNKKK